MVAADDFKVTLFGLVLAGGRSSRMGQDKGELTYPPSHLNQRERCRELLAPHCDQVFISLRPDQRGFPLATRIDDDPSAGSQGPASGLLSAHRAYPNVAWLVLACDFPFARSDDIQRLVAARAPAQDAIAWQHEDGTLEPLFTLWEIPALQALSQPPAPASPRRVLEGLRTRLLKPPRPDTLINVNTPAARIAARSAPQSGPKI